LLRHATALKPWLGMSGYERRVDEALSIAIRPGDCVWDVGANVGLYTERFAAAVGGSGQVGAVEPVATARAAPLARVAGMPQVRVRAEALGAARSSVTVKLDADPTSPTNTLSHIVSPTEAGTQRVDVAAADDLVAAGEAS